VSYQISVFMFREKTILCRLVLAFTYKMHAK